MFNPTELMQAILKSEEAQYIIDRISPIYGKARSFLYLLQAIGVALDEAEGCKNDFDSQSIVSKATWALKYYEEEYGVTTNTSLPDEQRRSNIYAAIRFKVPLNPTKVASIMSAIGKTETTIEENTGKNKFTVHSKPTRLYQNMVDFLNNAKPAHTIYDFIISDDIESEQTLYGAFNAITLPVHYVDFGGITEIETTETLFGGFQLLSIPVTSVDFGGEL